MELQEILAILPSSIGAFLVIVAAGVMGLFRSMTLSKKAYNDTLDSLERQIRTLKRENEMLSAHVAVLEKRIRGIEGSF